jgi:Mn-dependent DtxR family transcriptional regulator
MDRLHAKGYISDPKSQAKSVVMTEEGERLAQKLLRSTSAASPEPSVQDARLSSKA